jgi:hypothetical protein
MRDLIIFWVVVFLVVITWRHNAAVVAVLIAAYLARCYFWPNKEDHILYLAGAVIGPTAEIVATHAGIWTYTQPTFLNIPVWLPFAWGFAVVLIVRIAQTFIKN